MSSTPVPPMSSIPAPTGSQDPAKVADGFEALFVSMLLEPMETSSAFFGDGAGGRTFAGLFRQQLADQVASSRPLGIADRIEKNLIARQRAVMSLQKGNVVTSTASRDARLKVSVDDLCDVFQRLQGLHGKLLGVLREKERALVEVDLPQIEELRISEEAVLREVIDEEKERLLITEEVGDLLGCERPISVRVSEILPNLSEEQAERLSFRRDELREVAIELASQNSTNRALIEHSIDHIQLFMSRIACEQEGGPRYGRDGVSSDPGGGSLFMDRKV